jgi:isopenicillin N synthase-like dioxygenase
VVSLWILPRSRGDPDRLGGELTSGRPDLKEGLYFGEELAEADARVRAGIPLHGANLFPDLPGFRDAVLDYMAAMSRPCTAWDGRRPQPV